jgi:hypothetical protein
MFAKLAKIQAFGSRRAASGSGRLVPSNDNRLGTRRADARLRSEQRILVCRWRSAAAGGRLECRWSRELVDAMPAEEPQRQLMRNSATHATDSPKEVDPCLPSAKPSPSCIKCAAGPRRAFFASRAASSAFASVVTNETSPLPLSFASLFSQ